MPLTFTRALAVGTTAALLSLGLMPAVTATAAPTTTPTSCSGVWVAVQFEDATAPALGCASAYTSGTEALSSAGFDVAQSGGFVSQVDTLPADPNYGTNGGYYWSYWYASVAADGTLSSWDYQSDGSNNTTPTTDKIEGWRLTNSFSATGPDITSVPVTPASATPTPTPSPSSSTTTAPPIETSSARSAGKWLAASVPTSWDSPGTAVDVGLGLAARECAYAGKLEKITDYLASQADDYSATSAYAAAKLAIFVSTVGEDPTDFGGVDLAKRIVKGASSQGRLGTADDFAFGQALAMIGLKRTGTTPSAAMVDYLVSKQLASGAWGFGSTDDPDSTALALMALSDDVITPTTATKEAVDEATSWAAGAKKSAGYWQNYSPVDSTALLISALQVHGVSVNDSLTWLRDQQLNNGGFPNTLNGTTSNQLSTATALLALTANTYATLSAPLATCTASDSNADGSATLPRTGTDASWPLGWAGLGLITLGAVLVAARTERYLPRHARR